MKFFYLEISRNPLVVNKVHEHTCPILPPMTLRTYLGPFNNAGEALRRALENKENAVACPDCCQGKMSSVAFFTHAGL